MKKAVMMMASAPDRWENRLLKAVQSMPDDAPLVCNYAEFDEHEGADRLYLAPLFYKTDGTDGRTLSRLPALL